MALSLGNRYDSKTKYNPVSKKFLDRYRNKGCRTLLFDQMSDYHTDSNIIVVIPAYKEDLITLTNCLDSLNKTDGVCKLPVMLLINYKTTDSVEIKSISKDTFQILKAKKEDYPRLDLFVFIEELNGKKAGVGMARKELMDCAFLLFQKRKQNGLIVNLDADCTVDRNYPSAIKTYFEKQESVEAASIRFAHAIEPETKSSEAITNYELHLRYFINMQKWLGLPFAFQTVGSAMGVRAEAYAKEGGMAKRQAGEDFYFLHKYSKNLTLGEINETCVYPLSRSSDRVPFGTGKAVQNILDRPLETYSSYNPESFIMLREWLQKINPLLYNQAPSEDYPVPVDRHMKNYLETNDFAFAYQNDIITAKAGITRVKKFFQWLDAFRLFKYLHYMRDTGLEDVSILSCAETLFRMNNWDKNNTELEYLQALRIRDMKADYHYQWRAAFISNPSSTSAS